MLLELTSWRAHESGIGSKTKQNKTTEKKKKKKKKTRHATNTKSATSRSKRCGRYVIIDNR